MAFLPSIQSDFGSGRSQTKKWSCPSSFDNCKYPSWNYLAKVDGSRTCSYIYDFKLYLFSGTFRCANLFPSYCGSMLRNYTNYLFQWLFKHGLARHFHWTQTWPWKEKEDRTFICKYTRMLKKGCRSSGHCENKSTTNSSLQHKINTFQLD